MAQDNRLHTQLRNFTSIYDKDSKIRNITAVTSVNKRRPVSCPVSRQRSFSAKYGYSQPGHLKPYLDSSAGLDKWPAQIGGHEASPLSINLTKHRHLVVVDGDANRVQSTTKPRFLNTLETFVKTELRNLGVSEQPSELRLQVFRETFDLLIQDFKTYQTILSSIKNEYERVLTLQREEIQQLKPLKQMLVTVSEQCDQRIVKIREKEKHEIMDLVQENRTLHKTVDSLQVSQLELEAQVARLQEEIQSDYRLLRDEKDARKLLVVKVNEYRMQQEDLALATESYLQTNEDAKSDPVILKMALKGARNREKDLTQEIEKLELEIASYVSVVPCKDFEEVKQRSKELEEQLQESREELDRTKEQNNVLHNNYSEIREEKERLQEEFDKIRTRSFTPRPDWNKCADYVPGGIVRWKELSRGKHSDELVAVLLKELTTAKKEDSTPISVTADGQGEDGFLLLTCQLAILLTQHNMETTKDGLVKKADFQTVLEGFFQSKNEESIGALMKCADFQLDARAYSEFAYTKLFWEDDDGKLGDFLAELSSQYHRERREYVEEIWEELINTDPVTLEDLQRAISIVDPEITPTDMNKYLCYGFDVNAKDKLSDVQPVEISTLLSRLQKSSIRRIGKTA